MVRQRNRDGTTAYATLASWDMLRLGTISESSRRLDAGRHRAFVLTGDSGEASAGVRLITTGAIPSRPILLDRAQ